MASGGKRRLLAAGARIVLGLGAFASIAAAPSVEAAAATAARVGAACGGLITPDGALPKLVRHGLAEVGKATGAATQEVVLAARTAAVALIEADRRSDEPPSDPAGAPARVSGPTPAATADAATPRLNPSGRAMVILAPVNDRDTHLGDVELRVQPDDSIEVSVSQIADLLDRAFDPAAVASVRALGGPGEFAPLASFAAAGFPLSFNPRTLTVSVEAPATARGRRSIALADYDRQRYGDFAAPEGVSGYLNLRGATSYVHQGYGDTGFTDPVVTLDGAFRMNGLVLENEASWSGTDSRFRREGTRFVYDDTQRLSRWMAGDLRPMSRGFQSGETMAGVGVMRAYSLLDPHRNVTPRGGRSFVLDREATVEAIVNGRSVRTLRLDPGTYDISDFPFVQGSNEVDLVIVDDTGRRETISFSLFLGRTQLAPGLAEFGVYAGVRSALGRDRIDYSHVPVVSGFYRRGFSEHLTLGGNFQADDTSQMIAGEAVWGSPIGVVGADVAVSHNDVYGDGWAFNTTLERLIETHEAGALSIFAALEARSRHFGPPGLVTAENPYAFNVALGINRSFADSSFVGAQARYAQARGDIEDERGVRLSYGRPLGDLASVVFDADWQDGGFGDGVAFRVSLIRRFGRSGSMRAEYDTRSERARVGYQTSGGRGVGAWSASGTLETGPEAHGFNGSASYAANRVELGLAHSTAYSQVSDEISDQRTSIRAATGIAFAGGQFAIGRPVMDGFVIVRPYAGARDTVIEVEPGSDGYFARSGALGPALYGQLNAHSPRTVIYDAPFATGSFDVGQGAVGVQPPYRAGYLVTVGSDYNLTVLGRLLDADGAPVALLTGVATELSGEGRQVEVFTNRQGTFGATGLRPGRWRIETQGSVRLRFEVDIPDSPDGIVRLGDLRPAP